VYLYLDIGSGKLNPEKRQEVPHHLIDVVPPDYGFDTAEYCRRAAIATDEIRSRGKIPMFVGGTGFYIDSFFKGLSPVPDIDPEVRSMLEKEYYDRGLDALYEELLSADPESAARVHRNDRQRVLRALQVFRGTGITLSEYRNKRISRESDETCYIGIRCGKKELDRRIENRVDGMIDSGFLDEVKMLRSKGYDSRYSSMKSIGYFELGQHLDGEFSVSDAVDRIKKETREYAKKQITWFKRNRRFNWFDRDDLDGIASCVSKWLSES
jgi:tRNA dimethylallyltransferase